MFYTIRKNPTVAYWAMMLLVLASGSPVFSAYGSFIYVVIAGLIMLEIMRFRKLHSEFTRVWAYIILMLIIFLCQYLTFWWNTTAGIINFIAKILFGCYVMLSLGTRFRYVYLKVLYHLSIIALIFYTFQCITGIRINLIPADERGGSILFYFGRFYDDRNCGPFWEPGAYGCYLMLVPLMFINNLKFLFKRYRRECMVLIIALLTTQSTTAYLSFAALLFIYLALHTKSLSKYFYIAMAAFIAIYVYTSAEFLQEKIEHQNESALESRGEFNATRVGTFFFDMYYFKKHPITGNGLHSRTRYSEHQFLMKLWEKGELAKAGNAFSDFLAKMGISFYLIFIYFFYKTNKRTLRSRDYISFFAIFIMLLFGEPLFNYPIALSLPFLKLGVIEYKKLKRYALGKALLPENKSQLSKPALLDNYKANNL